MHRATKQTTLPFSSSPPPQALDAKTHKPPRPPTPTPVLPPASEEQSKVVESLRKGNCVVCESSAGSGKTTTGLHCALTVNEHTLFIMFNKILSDECRETIRRHGLSNLVQCSTFHAAMKVGIELERRLDEWKKGHNLPSRFAQKLIILDECQDMSEDIYEALTFCLPLDARLLVLGDPKQLVYDIFPGSRKARLEYLEQAPKYFGAFSEGRTWDRMQLRVSYRLAPKIATFANVVWGTSIMAGNLRTDDRPVEYWHVPAFNTDVLCERIAGVIDEAERLHDVMIVAPTIEKNAPLKRVVNRLQTKEDEAGKRKYNFAWSSDKGKSVGKKDLDNKVLVTTMCKSKGLEAPVVIVWGLSMYDAKRASDNHNQYGVALSRSSGRLVVLHLQGSEEFPQDYFPTLSKHLLYDLAQKGVVDVRMDGLPEGMELTQTAATPQVMWASELAHHLTSRSVDELVGMVEWSEEGGEGERAGASRIEFRPTHTFHTGVHATTESCADLYAAAVPLALEHARNEGRIEAVMRILRPFTVDEKLSYTWSMVEETLQRKGVHPSALAPLLGRFRTAAKAAGTEYVKGGKLLSLLRKQELVHEDDGVPFGVCSLNLYDETFKPLARPLQELYHSKGRKSASDFMFMANAVMAYGAKHSKLHQIGVQGPRQYEQWVDADAFGEAERRLAASMDGEDVLAFSKEVSCEEFRCEGGKGGATFSGVAAVVDCVSTASAFSNIVTSGAITNAQRLKALVGAYLVAQEGGRPFRCVVNSYWRGGRSCATASDQAAPAFWGALRGHVEGNGV